MVSLIVYGDTRLFPYSYDKVAKEPKMYIELEDSTTYINNKVSELVDGFELSAYPNPFNSLVNIHFTLQSPDKSNITIYDMKKSSESLR